VSIFLPKHHTYSPALSRLPLLTVALNSHHLSLRSHLSSSHSLESTGEVVSKLDVLVCPHLLLLVAATSYVPDERVVDRYDDESGRKGNSDGVATMAPIESEEDILVVLRVG
jgi:hypothetical protein